MVTAIAEMVNAVEQRTATRNFFRWSAILPIVKECTCGAENACTHAREKGFTIHLTKAMAIWHWHGQGR